jgi:hypothetical protein
MDLGARFSSAMTTRRAGACDDCHSTRVFAKYADTQEPDACQEHQYGT